MFYSCTEKECSRIFVNKKALREHMRTHSQNRPYICDLCDQSFTQFSSLQKHGRVHDKLKPFKCDAEGCNHSFSQISNLIRHQRIHTGEKPFTCEVCGKKFSSGSNLKQHEQVHRANLKRQSFKCIFGNCQNKYLYQSSLKKHFQTSHAEEYKKYLDDKKIATKGYKEKPLANSVVPPQNDNNKQLESIMGQWETNKLKRPVSSGSDQAQDSRYRRPKMDSSDFMHQEMQKRARQDNSQASYTLQNSRNMLYNSQDRFFSNHEDPLHTTSYLFQHGMTSEPRAFDMPPNQTIRTLNERRMSFNPFNIRNPLLQDLQKLSTRQKKSNSIKSLKVFSEDLQYEKNGNLADHSPKRKEVVRKPLPTLKSLAKENKKLQKLLRISLKQRQRPQDSIAPNMIHMTDSSYNTSFGSEILMNATIVADSSRDKQEVSKQSVKAEKRSTKGNSRNLPPGFKSKIKKLRSQFFAAENVDLEESELSLCSDEAESGDQKEPEEQKELEFQRQAVSVDDNRTNSKDSNIENMPKPLSQVMANFNNKESTDLKNRTVPRNSQMSNSGYHSQESPAFTFNTIHGKKQQGSEKSRKSSHIIDSKSKKSMSADNLASQNKFALNNKKETDSVQSINNFRQQEVLLGINQKVKQLNHEFERTLLFANQQQAKHTQDLNEKNAIIMLQKQKIHYLMEKVDEMRFSLIKSQQEFKDQKTLFESTNFKAKLSSYEQANDKKRQSSMYNQASTESIQAKQQQSHTDKQQSEPQHMMEFSNVQDHEMNTLQSQQQLQQDMPQQQMMSSQGQHYQQQDQQQIQQQLPNGSMLPPNLAHQQNPWQQQVPPQMQLQQSISQQQSKMLDANSAMRMLQMGNMPDNSQFDPALIKIIIMQQQQLISLLNEKLKSNQAQTEFGNGAQQDQKNPMGKPQAQSRNGSITNSLNSRVQLGLETLSDKNQRRGGTINNVQLNKSNGGQFGIEGYISNYEFKPGVDQLTAAAAAKDNCQSMDPYSMFNRIGNLEKSRLNEQDQDEKRSLAELKLNSEEINRQLNKMASSMNNYEFDMSMGHFIQPIHNRPLMDSLSRFRSEKRNSQSSNEVTSFTGFLAQANADELNKQQQFFNLLYPWQQQATRTNELSINNALVQNVGMLPQQQQQTAGNEDKNQAATPKQPNATKNPSLTNYSFHNKDKMSTMNPEQTPVNNGSDSQKQTTAQQNGVADPTDPKELQSPKSAAPEQQLKSQQQPQVNSVTQRGRRLLRPINFPKKPKVGLSQFSKARNISDDESQRSRKSSRPRRQTSTTNTTK